jgi:hypothetical protein
MMTLRCSREEDLLDVLASGRWPVACERELVEHVRDCLECRDLLVVAEALITDRREAEAAVAVPTSSAVWWRMQLRREREAKDVAARTVGRVHGVVVGLTVAVIVVVLVMTSLARIGWGWVTSTMPRVEELAGLSSAVPLTVVVFVALAILVFAPVAVYLALAEE